MDIKPQYLRTHGKYGVMAAQGACERDVPAPLRGLLQEPAAGTAAREPEAAKKPSLDNGRKIERQKAGKLDFEDFFESQVGACSKFTGRVVPFAQC
jgi:hypothetical protein